MKRNQLNDIVINAITSNSFSKPTEFDEYRANSNTPGIMAFKLDDDFSIDEIDFIEMQMNIEDELEEVGGSDLLEDIVWPDWYYDNDITVGDIVNIIVKSNAVKLED